MARYDETTTPLGGGATWISRSLYTNTDDSLTGSVFADQAGTLYIEQSADGTNWDVSTSYAIVASTGRGFQEVILLPIIRVRYTNGATPQTTFRLYARMSASGLD